MDRDAHIWLLHHLFLPAINSDAEQWADAWNNHTLSFRGERQRSPADMYLFGMIQNGPRGLHILMRMLMTYKVMGLIGRITTMTAFLSITIALISPTTKEIILFLPPRTDPLQKPLLVWMSFHLAALSPLLRLSSSTLSCSSCHTSIARAWTCVVSFGYRHLIFVTTYCLSNMHLWVISFDIVTVYFLGNMYFKWINCVPQQNNT